MPQHYTNPKYSDPLWDDMPPMQLVATMDTHLTSIKMLRHDRPAGIVSFSEIEAAEADIGGIARIDILNDPRFPSAVVRMYRANWRLHEQPVIARELRNGWTVQDVCTFLEFNGWTVRRWETGARAWRFVPRPVRSRQSAYKYRDSLLKRIHEGDGPPIRNVYAYDLCYDL